jgi:predicted ATPase
MSAAGSSRFVNREEEMKRIRDALKAASEGKGQLLLVRGEAGSGKTRMVEEAAAKAERLGFKIGFGTALAESVVPYHAWKNVMEGLGLDAILEEAGPPKLLGLYLLDAEGHELARVEREGNDVDDGRLTSSVDILKEYAQGSLDSKKCEWVEGQLAMMREQDNRVLASGDADFTVGAVLEGQEDEKFLADLLALANTIVSMGLDLRLDEEQVAAEASLRELLESRKYEGIDYVQHDPKLRRARFFEQVTLGIARRADLSPVLVVFDDLQWADPTSLDLLHYVTRNTHEARVVLVGTYRIEEAESRPHLRGALKEMELEDLVTEMDLKGLAQHDLADLAESFIGSHGLPDAFVDRLWRETRGNPLFVREVLRGLEEDGAMALKGGIKCLVRPIDQLALPERIREVIRTRLERLPEEDRRLLDAAATCGTRFTAAFVAKVAEEGKVEALNGLTAIARVHGLLRLTEDGFAFDHPAVQEAIYDDVQPEVRRAYHKEAAEWLELVGGPLEDVAEHYYRCQDWERAVPHLIQAAEKAVEQFSNAEAIRFYTEALELERDTGRKREILEARGAIHMLLGDYEVGLRAYESALELAEEDRQKARIFVGIGEVYHKIGSFKDSLEASTHALRLVEGACSEEEALALHNIGLTSSETGDLEQALNSLKKGLAVAEKIKDYAVANRCMNTIGVVYRKQGHLDQALECYSKSMAIAEELHDQAGIAWNLNNIAILNSIRGNRDQALKYFEKHLAIKEKIGDPWAIAGTLNNIGLVHKGRGDYGMALKCLERGANIAKKGGHLDFLATLFASIGNVHYARDNYDQALDYLHRALDLNEKIGKKFGIAVSLLNIGNVYLERQDYEQALEYYDRSVEISEDIGERRARSHSYLGIAEVHLEKRDFAKAMEFCNEALDFSIRTGVKEITASSMRILGMINRERNRWNEAIEDFQESIGISEEIGSRLDAGKSHYEFGCMWKRHGDIARAEEHLQVAVDILEMIGSKERLKKARAVYASLGEGHPPEHPV